MSWGKENLNFERSSIVSKTKEKDVNEKKKQYFSAAFAYL